MSYTYAFEKLQVWHDARRLVSSLYKITDCFPSAEKFGSINQIRRAAISVVSNIAEGSARTSMKDRAHFFQMAFSSVIEVLNQLIIATDLNYVKEDVLRNIRSEIESVSNKINSLRKSCLN